MLGDALFFPKARDGWLKTVGIGGVLFVTSFLVVPYLVLAGYFVRVIRSGSTGGSQPPVFEEWLDLFIDGLILSTIQIIYGIVGIGIPVVIAVMTVSRPLDPMLSTGEIVLLVCAYLFAFFVSYVSLAAVARFAHEERFEAAFQMRAVFRTVCTSEFFVTWVLSFSVYLILGTISALLSPSIYLILGPVGVLLFLIVVGLLFLFYISVASYYLIGRGYRKVNTHRTNRTSLDSTTMDIDE
jgi:hypothetical protein